MDELKERKVRRLEKQLVELYEAAYNAYWNIGELACQAIEREMAGIEAELVEALNAFFREENCQALMAMEKWIEDMARGAS